jgi:hypothetical protein
MPSLRRAMRMNTSKSASPNLADISQRRFADRHRPTRIVDTRGLVVQCFTAAEEWLRKTAGEPDGQ